MVEAVTIGVPIQVLNPVAKRVKTSLAAELGVDVEAIEITVRM